MKRIKPSCNWQNVYYLDIGPRCSFVFHCSDRHKADHPGLALALCTGDCEIGPLLHMTYCKRTTRSMVHSHRSLQQSK